jgi:hypothetical protein
MRSRTLIPTLVVVAGAFSLLVAGCGGASPGVAKLGSSKIGATANPQTGLLAYSQCMRSHGVATFPDPTPSQGIPKDEVVPLVSSPKFQPASSYCQHLMPAAGLGPSPATAEETHARVVDLLSFARCMRSHGVTSFPDPTAQGDLSVEMIQAQGVDVHSPAVLRVAQTCLPASHGALTSAKIRAAISDGGA